MSAAFDAEPYESLADFHQDWEEILGYPLHLYDTEELVKIAEDSCCRLPQMPVLPELILVFARILATPQKVFSHVDENLRAMIGVISQRLVLPTTENYIRYKRDGEVLQEDPEQACGSDRTPHRLAHALSTPPLLPAM